MEEFPSNAHNKTEPAREPRIEKVIEGNVTTRKPSVGRRFKETFAGEDSSSVWEYVLLDVLVPAVKDMVVDAGQQALEKLIFGEARPGNRRSFSRAAPSSNGHISYNGVSKVGTRPDPRRELSRSARSAHTFDDIVFEQRHQATDVLDKLYETLEKYDLVTVQDLYDACGITSSFTDAKYGWDSLSGSGVDRVRGGYLLRLPKPEPIK